MITLEDRQRKEIAFWHAHDEETVHAAEPQNLALKMPALPILLDCLSRYAALFDAGRILELGAGQGWGSCVVKHCFPLAEVTATDISDRALLALPAWEHVFRVAVDRRYACLSYAIPEPIGSIDLIFAFASAHHFAAHRRTLAEVARVLRPGAHAVYLYEPACPQFWHPLAYARVNRKRPEVPEDVLIVSKLRALASEVGLDFCVDYYPSTANRGPKETIYYSIIGTSRLLRRVLPCTANFIFVKP